MAEDRDRCSFEFDPVAWERKHDKTCFVDPTSEHDADILTKNADGDSVWWCPYEATDGEGECMFHLPQDADAKPDAETVADMFLEITNGKHDALDDDGLRPARFISAEFESLDLDTEQVGDGRAIDLRHSEVGSAKWKVENVDAKLLDARGVSVRGNWDCHGVTFGGGTAFNEAEFGGDTWFEEAEFGEDTWFEEAEFGGDAWFDEAEFGGDAWFDETKFGGETWFWGAEFGGIAMFTEAEFGGGTRFSVAEFGESAVFNEAEFGGGTTFSEAKFGGDALFQKAGFGGDVWFKKAKFGGGAWFLWAEFRGDTRFSEAKFEVGAKFTADGWYSISQFQGDADFSDVTADGPLRFADEHHSPPGRPHTFLGKVDFSGADVPDAEFLSVSFREAPTFENTDLTRADLSDSSFEGATFAGANLTRGNLSETSVPRADFEDAFLSQASLYGTDLTNARLYGARMGGAHISDHTDFGVRDQSDQDRSSPLPFRNPKPRVRYDPRNPEYDRFAENDGDDTTISDYTRAATVYTEIERIAEENADSELASRCYLWRKDMQRKRYWSDEGRGNTSEWIKGGRSTLANLFVRYGESPLRVTGIAGLVIVGCALLYYLLNLIEYSTSPSQLTLLSAVGTTPPNSVVTFVDALYFSTLTFSTLGMGTFQPSGPIGRAVTIFETLSGVVLLALLVFVFGRRATR